jgi:hypothetical protein
MAFQVFEQVEVIGYFHCLKFEIKRFKWRNSIYKVSKINSNWKTPKGNSYIYHYSVICEKQSVICELSFNLNDLKWELIQYDNL